MRIAGRRSSGRTQGKYYTAINCETTYLVGTEVPTYTSNETFLSDLNQRGAPNSTMVTDWMAPMTRGGDLIQ